MKRDFFLYVVNVILLTIMTIYSVVILRSIQNDLETELHIHRIRNEAESVCQLVQVYTPNTSKQIDVDAVIKNYLACVDDRSGYTTPENNIHK